MSEKTLKKVLFWTDDFNEHAMQIRKELIEPGIFYSFDEGNRFTFKLDFVKKLAIAKQHYSENKYDVIMIDYGLLGDEVGSIQFLAEAHKNSVKLAFCGGMAASYSRDCKKIFPDAEFLLCIPACSTTAEEMLWCLYGLFK
jgi:hypothetical protein